MKRSIQNTFAAFSILNATIFTILALGILYAIFFCGCASSPKIKDYEGGPSVKVQEQTVVVGTRPWVDLGESSMDRPVLRVARVNNTFNFPVEVLVECPRIRGWIKVDRSSSRRIYYTTTLQRQYKNNCRVKAGRVSHK